MNEEQREFEELCKSNPNYPKDFELHKMYQGHIKKWKPLIESNDPLIYSEWEWQDWEYSWWYDNDWWCDPSVSDVATILSVVDTPLLDTSNFPYLCDGYEWSTLLRPEKHRIEWRRLDLWRTQYYPRYKRLELIQFIFQSYRYKIENTYGCDVFYNPRDNSSLSKMELVKSVQRITEKGLNPFDIVYKTPVHQRIGLRRVIGLSAFIIVVFVIWWQMVILVDK